MGSIPQGNAAPLETDGSGSNSNGVVVTNQFSYDIDTMPTPARQPDSVSFGIKGPVKPMNPNRQTGGFGKLKNSLKGSDVDSSNDEGS